jgi:precorrin-3B C17-methyltransferase
MGNAMSGKLTVVGLGPGNAKQLTPEASDALQAADVVFGYGPYLDRLPERAGQRRCASDNRQEIDRATQALTDAALGANVAVVSGGDPGVFAMAAAVCEALELGPAAWRELDLSIVPGITGMLAVAARVGAPLGHDFCVLSLSDNLKPWSLVERRLAAAAGAGFVIALYNPISRARPWQLDRAFETLRATLPAQTPVVFGRAVGRTDERVRVTTLSAAAGTAADMATCVIVGSSDTRIVERPNRPALVYTPRSAPVAST